MGELEVLAHPLGVDGHPLDQAASRGAACSRAGSSRRAGSPARRRSGRCRARARGRRSRARPGRSRAGRGRARDPLGADRVALVRHRRGALLARRRTAPRPRAPRCAAGCGSRCAKRSRPAPAIAIAASSSAWRSRGTTWVETSSRAQAEPLHHRAPRPRAAPRRRCRPRRRACRPRPARRRRSSRSRLRSASKAKPARRRPKVVGSAWTPWVRPTQSVSRCSQRPLDQRVAVARRPASDDLAGLAQLQRERRVEHVGGGEPVVDPAPVLADRGGDDVDEGGDVVVGDPLALLDRLDRERRRARGTPPPPRAGTTALARPRPRSRPARPRASPRISPLRRDQTAPISGAACSDGDHSS